MTIMETATIALIIAGTIIMIASANNSRHAFEIVQAGRYRAGWNVVRYLMVVFVAAYAAMLSVVILGHEGILELALGAILILGSITMYTVVRLVYRSARESQTMSEIGRVINSSPSIQDVWDDVTELIRAEVPYDRISIGTFDYSRDQWVHTYIKGVEIPVWAIGDALPPTGSINTRTVDDVRGQVMRTDPANISAEELRAQKPAIDAGLMSGVTVPLIANNVVVAGMNLRSAKPNAYSDRDLGVVNRIAGQIAGAVQNSILHQNLERSAEEAEALAEIGLIINSSLAIDEVYEGFALAVATIIPFDRIAVSRIDRDAGINKTTYISGIAVSDRRPGDEMPIEGTFAQEVLNQGSALLLVGEPDSPEVRKYLGMVNTFQSGIRSCIAAPLVSRDEIIGILYIQSRDIDAYDSSHTVLASRIASQMSEGIANAELHATIEQEAREREAIGEIGRIISSSLAIEEVYEAFATNFESLIPFDTINISSIDHDTDSLTVLYGYGVAVAGRQPGARIQIEGTLAGVTAAKRQSAIVQDEQESIRQRYPMLAPALDAGLRSFLAVPLIHNDKAIGVLQVRSTTPNAYTEAHLELAERISHQIAGAIDNARLHGILENAAREREVLAEIGRVISSSIEIEEVYESFARQVKRLLPFDRLSVTTLEADTGRITHPYVSGIRIPGWEPGEYQLYDGSATQKVLEGRKGLLLAGDDRNASGSASAFPSLSPADSSGLLSMVAVPLYASDQPVGTLTLRASQPNAYTRESVELAQRIGNQIAGAIANAQLYARLNTAQTALEDSERRYRTLIESGSDVVYTSDESGNFNFVAPAVKRLTGYSPDELEGKHFTFLIHKDWVNETRQFYSRQLKERDLETTFQFPITTKSGQTRWVEQTVTLLNPTEGLPNFHGVVRDITDRRAAEEAELQRAAAEARAEALRRTSQRVVTAQETLRRDIAQQLHGSVQNRLILLMHRLELARSKVSDEDANRDIQAIHQDLHTILETDIRNISRQLYPAILRQGIVPAIQMLTDQIEPMIPVRLHIDDELVRQERTDRRLTPEPVRLAIFRIAEEALTNIVKHAKASAVEVELKLAEDQNGLRLMVRDDGLGFDLANTRGSVGLAGMEDYANMMNGTYGIWSEPGTGTVVEATLPISAPEEPTEPTAASSE